MSNFSRTTKGFLTLAVLAILAAACSSPKYYVFKTIKHTPVEKTETKQEAVLKEKEELSPAPAKEEVAVASTEKHAEQPNLVEISKHVKEKATPIKHEKISKFEEIKTAIQVRKEVRKIKKALEKQQDPAQEPEAAGEGKSQFIALLLAILVGYIGIHRFYLGYTTIGIIQLLTLGGCGVWALIDLIRIAMGDLKPVDGDYEETL